VYLVMDPNPTLHQWRCCSCGTLLGVERQGRLHLKYKSAQYVVTGMVTSVCRRCDTTNQIECRPEEAAPGT
jgi:hypothetical protein